MSNKTIDGVPREQLEVMLTAHQSWPSYDKARKELRALLDAPAELVEVCNADNADQALMLLDFALSFALCNLDHGGTRRDVKKAQAHLESYRKFKAAQPQGEPVAWQHRVTAGPQTGWSLWAPGRGKEYAEHYTVEVRPLYAEQPAPVAQKYDDVLLPFLGMMRKELHANSGKGDRDGWLGMTSGSALEEINHHRDKLWYAVATSNPEAIREHAADVANCAMMVADVCGVLK